MLPFDELNVLNKTEVPPRSVDIDQYFDEMELSDSEKEDRKEFAEKLEDRLFLILAFLYVILERKAYGGIQSVKDRLEKEITDLVKEYTYPDITMSDYIRNYVAEFVDSTVRNAERYIGGVADNPEQEENVDDKKLSYWFSEDRAKYNAENEANTIFNYEQFRQAKADGLAYKHWITMKDERVRRTHAEVDDVVIPIDEPFEVGGYKMMYPKDSSLGAGPEEIVNCRCTVEYLDDSPSGLATANALFVNKRELLFKNAKNIKPIPNFEDFTCHATPDAFQIDLVGDGKEEDYIDLTPEEFAERIKSSSTYRGGNVRLISCQAGAKKHGAAQRLANSLGKKVMASTEKVHVDEDGNIFLSDSDTLAQMWYYSTEERDSFHETGKWIVFTPRFNGR